MEVSRSVPALLVSLGVVVAGTLALASAHPGNSDDSFILLVHARGLLEGLGWEYNPGEGPVEGVTSLLDLGLKTLALAWAPGDGVRVLWRVTGLLYLLTLAACTLHPRRTRGWPLVAGALALCPGLAEGTSYLLETPLYLGLLVWAARVVPRSSDSPSGDLWAWLAAAGLVLVRPEGLAVAAVFLVGRALASRGAGRWRVAAAVALVAVALFGWRWWTFGTWAPNSYHAKASSSMLHELEDGVAYLAQALAGAGRPGLAPAFTGALLVGVTLAVALLGPFVASRVAPRDGGRGLELQTLCWSATVALAVLVVGGGDGYRGLRLLAPVCMLSLLALGSWFQGGGRGSRVAALLLALVLGARVMEIAPGAPAKVESLAGLVDGTAVPDFEARRALARGLVAAAPEEVVAQRHYQALKYFAPELRVLDLTGINHEAIARRPAPGPVRFGRDALDVALASGVGAIHLDVVPWRRESASLHSVRALARSRTGWATLLGGELPAGELLEALVANYRCASLPGPAGPGTWANLLVRADLAAAFRRAGFGVGPP